MQADKPIAIATIFFATLFAVFLFTVPQYRNFSKLRGDLAQKKAEYNARYDYYNQIVKTYNEIQVRKEEIKKIDDALPGAQDFGRLVYYLQKTATQSGLMVKDLYLAKGSVASKQQKTAEGGIKDTVFSANLSGNYGSLENFLVSLERSARIFEVTNISFSAQGQTSLAKPNAGGLITFSVQILCKSY